jgi:hypothetical protein
MYCTIEKCPNAKHHLFSVAKPAVMQVMQCMTKNFPKNV